jgi:hypothetical protein
MEFQERRRGTRVALARGPELRLSRRVRVRVVDISAGGALVAPEEQLPVGARGRLRVLLGGENFEASVEIRREHGHAGTPILQGAVIVSADQANQAALEQFLRRSP